MRIFFFIEGDVLYFCRLYLVFGLAILSEALTTLCALSYDCSFLERRALAML